MNPEHLGLLRQALPFINKFKNKTFVVKIGGEIADSEATLHSFCEEVALLAQVGIHVVMVHGGGKQATELSQQLGIEPKMIQGRRVTDEKTLDVVMMVFAGTINTEILAALREYGAEAVGISGVDGGNIGTEDMSIQETMGHIFDRTGEHLGTTDLGVIAARRTLMKAALALRDHGTPPPGLDVPDAYCVRSPGFVVDRGADWFSVVKERWHGQPGLAYHNQQGRTR